MNIITGALGVGKTTALRHLLSQRPPNERWAIVVNEFGALGIDVRSVTLNLFPAAYRMPTMLRPQENSSTFEHAP